MKLDVQGGEHYGKITFTRYCMKSKLPIILLTGLVLLSFWQIAGRISAQQQKLTLAQVLTALQTQGRTSETNTLAKRNVYIAKRVRQVGVTFPLTPEFESELRNAGATNELIEAIRRNSPPLPTPKPTPTPIVVVKEVPATPTPVPTPTPERPPFFKNQSGMEFVKISSGTFMMGSEKGDEDEKPVHSVTIGYDFYIGKYEVTIGEWKRVMGDLPQAMKSNLDKKFRDDDRQPVIRVSWNDAKDFIAKLNEANDGYEYRLPSEAEWEYAARAGTTTEFAFGDNLSSNLANFDGSFPSGNAPKRKSLERTTKVGSYEPNAWGIYDMHGNVWEWVEDIYAPDYKNFPADGSANLTVGNKEQRVLRGSAWNNRGDSLRSANRLAFIPVTRDWDIGFRVVAIPK